MAALCLTLLPLPAGAEVRLGLPGPAAHGYYSDISWNWAWAGIILFPVGIDFLSNFHFLSYIPLGWERLCLTEAGLSPLDIGLDSLQLCVSVNGQPGSAVKWLPGHTLVVLPAYTPGVGLMLLGLLGWSPRSPCHLPCILTCRHFFMCQLGWLLWSLHWRALQKRGNVTLLLSFQLLAAQMSLVQSLTVRWWTTKLNQTSKKSLIKLAAFRCLIIYQQTLRLQPPDYFSIVCIWENIILNTSRC